MLSSLNFDIPASQGSYLIAKCRLLFLSEALLIMEDQAAGNTLTNRGAPSSERRGFVVGQCKPWQESNLSFSFSPSISLSPSSITKYVSLSCPLSFSLSPFPSFSHTDL